MELQDEITSIIERGHDPFFVLDMDVLAFTGLCESCQRLSDVEKIESAEIAMLAAQGSAEGMTQKLKPYRDRVKEIVDTRKDAAAFHAKYANGI